MFVEWKELMYTSTPLWNAGITWNVYFLESGLSKLSKINATFTIGKTKSIKQQNKNPGVSVGSTISRGICFLCSSRISRSTLLLKSEHTSSYSISTPKHISSRI